VIGILYIQAAKGSNTIKGLPKIKRYFGSKLVCSSPWSEISRLTTLDPTVIKFIIMTAIEGSKLRFHIA
jgi:hypothetical protein